MAKQEDAPWKEIVDGEPVYNMDSDELNDDWLRSARLDSGSEEFKKREATPMVRSTKTNKKGE
jgi:hypothetical protein